MNTTAISVKDVSKAYRIYDGPLGRLRHLFGLGSPGTRREFPALRGIGFEVAKGERVGIIGRNGSGKSTLLQLICGIMRPSAGSIVVNGRVSALLELGSGFHPEFTGRENVFLQAAVLGLAHSEIEERLDDIRAFADIDEFFDRPVKTYSSGMFVRLAFSVAAQVIPDVLVVDEALSVGDMTFQKKCTRRMEELCASGATVLLVSHDLHLIERFCDRALVLDRGRCLCDASAAEATMFYLNLVREGSLQAPEHDAAAGPEQLYATGEASLLEVRTLDARGQPRDVFVTGEDIIVAARYRAHGPLRRLSFGCSVWAGVDARVGTASLRFEGSGPCEKELDGEFEVRMTLAAVPLLPGTYSLRGGIYDENLLHACCLWGWTGKPKGVFTIASSTVNGFVLKESLGFVMLPSRWEVREGGHE
ncbi:MAG: ABC transporter ATP-binding protein [Betaproteobacteria bacterium]|nr:ABC transporter ATP-binding protein [Betaproteobacteria bacterium]